MTMIGVVAGYVGAAAFGILVALLAVAPGGRPVGRLLMAAAAVTATWFALHAVYFQFGDDFPLSLVWLQQFEFARDALWLAFLGKLLFSIDKPAYRRRIFIALTALGIALVAASAAAWFPQAMVRLLDMDSNDVRKLYLVTALLSALGGMVLVEQVFRNTARDSRWALKHLCFGIGLIFAFDFYLYADAVLFNRLDLAIWTVRGAVNALAVPMIAISAARNREWDLNIFVSRRVVFHGVALLAAGIYLMVMAAAGYYIQARGGEWGRALTSAFFSAAILLLLTLFFSFQLRSRLRLFLAKHFYRNKYEYGEEWLKFTHALGQAALEPESLNRNLLAAVCDIVDSVGGIIWRKLPSGGYVVAANVSMYDDCRTEIKATDALIVELEHMPTVWDLTDDDMLESDRGVVLPQWLLDLPRIALLVPIVHHDELLAILALARPRTTHRLDWEDLNLLGIVARQAASYLALVRATDALSEARQFETFNRLSAFLVHDLKNVVAQLSLITSNARRHRDNPAFVDDAFTTVGDAVAKMNRMLASLRQMQSDVEVADTVDLEAVLDAAVSHKSTAEPRPVLRPSGVPVMVHADHDRLMSVIEHLLQNAIEATPADGRVEVGIKQVGDEVFATIADSGCGMDREFINNRLYKPFDTTKGKAGMGIGAYESRHVISSMRGKLLVDSVPGAGTTFTIVLPVARNADGLVAAEA